jgi:hypothetical protein
VSREDSSARIRALVLLLRTLNDPYESVPSLRLASQPGPAPSGRVPCSCARTVDARFGKDWRGAFDCPLCHGSGFRPLNAVLDAPQEDSDPKGHVYDPMTYGADRSGKQKPMLAVAKGSDPVEEERFPWERRHRSYAYLSRALDYLRTVDEVAWYYLTAAYCEGRYGFEGDEPRVGFAAGLACVRGLSFLERRMPVPLRLPAELQERFEADERTRQVLAQRRNGKSLSAIGRESGRSRRAVARSERRSVA